MVKNAFQPATLTVTSADFSSSLTAPFVFFVCKCAGSYYWSSVSIGIYDKYIKSRIKDLDDFEWCILIEDISDDTYETTERI